MLCEKLQGVGAVGEVAAGELETQGVALLPLPPA